MPFPLQIAIPSDGFPITLSAGETIIIVGANGSGKTRLASWLEERLGINVHRISAHRALTLNPSAVKVSEKQSAFRLLFGMEADSSRNYNEDYLMEIRRVRRWQSNASTTLLNDFEPLIQYLYAEQNNVAVRKLEDCYEGIDSETPITKLRKLTTIWDRVLPTKHLIVTGDDIQVNSKESKNRAPYSAADLSDGERAIFYMIGQVLFAPPGVIIFDEPELHVHRAVLGRLWDELEASRPDCAFVLITHDLEFASARTGRKLVVRSFSPPTSWTLEEVPHNSGFDEQIATLILGSRRPILFVEGDGGSLDLAIYRACYPDVTVLACGGCEQVIRSVRAMRANASLTRITCAGLIDADNRSEAELESLAVEGILALPVSEVENLLLLPAVAHAILDDNSYDEPEKADRISKLKADLFAEAANPEVQAAIVLAHCRRRIDRALRTISFEDVKNHHELSIELLARVNMIDINSFAADARSTIVEAIERDDLESLLRIYDRKGAGLAIAARHLRNSHKETFVKWFIRAMKDPKKTAIRDAVASVLPKVNAY